MADTLWPGIVVRETTSETGTTPRSSSANSPDIIMAGTAPLPDPSILTDSNNYSKEYDNSLYIGRYNYLYVRGKNFTGGTLSGSWNLFYSTPNLLLYPYLWQKNQLATSDGNTNPAFTIGAGAIGASTNAFTWKPDDTSDHYCMVAVANTPEHPNPVKDINCISDLAAIMKDNANIAQRNVHMIRGDIPEFADKVQYDQGAEAAMVDIAIKFSNLPKGSSCIVASGTPLNGKTLEYHVDKTESTDFKYAWTDLAVPKNWTTFFNFSVKFGSDWTGIPSTSHPSVIIRGELVQESTDRLYHLGRPADPDLRSGSKRLDAVGAPVHIITVGSTTTTCPEKKH